MRQTNTEVIVIDTSNDSSQPVEVGPSSKPITPSRGLTSVHPAIMRGSVVAKKCKHLVLLDIPHRSSLLSIAPKVPPQSSAPQHEGSSAFEQQADGDKPDNLTPQKRLSPTKGASPSGKNACSPEVIQFGTRDESPPHSTSSKKRDEKGSSKQQR
jgi:hypothetical protein